MSLGIYLVQVKCFTTGSEISTCDEAVAYLLPYIEASKQAGDKQGNGKI
jgi:hypothetical protein